MAYTPESMSQPSVMHLTSLHPALDSRIFNNECVSLVEAGYAVTLIAPGRGDFSKNGVRVETIPPHSNRWQRIAAGLAVFRKALNQRVDLYHFHDPELIPYCLLLRLFGCRVIMDVHEDQPAAMLHSRPSVPRYLRRSLAWTIGMIEEIAGRLMTGVVTTTQSTGRRFPAHKTAVVENFPNISDAPASGRRAISDRENYFVFTGTLGELQCIPELVEAFSKLPKELDLTLYLAGNFVPSELESRVKQLPGWDRVRFLGWQSREAIYDLLAKAKAGFVLYRSAHASPEFSSRKLYEYMAFGVPIIVSNVYSWKEIVEHYSCGVVLADPSAGSIAEAIISMSRSPEKLEQMSLNAKDAFDRDLNWSVSAGQLLLLYERALAT